MRIDRLRLFDVNLPLVHGFETSSHRKTGLDHLLVEATDADGRVGWGEIATPADPYYGSETTRAAWDIAQRYLVPAALGAPWETPEELEATWRRDPNLYYEDGYQEYAERGGEVRAATIGAVDWVEVDNHADLARAREIACRY